jgi:GH25 family lysozyme M1 (1,4-beta-N-acetylmuramidase)
MKYIKGVDLSHWEGYVNFTKAKEQGVEFEYSKTSQAFWLDDTFYPNHTSAKGIMKRGAFHFLDFRYEGNKQGEYFCDLVKDDPGEMPLCTDFEWNFWLPTPPNAFRILYDCMEAIVRKTGKKRSDLAIYTVPGFWLEAQNVARLEDITLARNNGYWKQYKLWIAHPDETPPINLGIWDEYFIWQNSFNGDGYLHGTSAKGVDLDRIPEDKWYEYFSTKPEVPVEPPVEEPKDEEMKFEVVVKELRVRDTYSTYGKIIKTIPLGTQVTVYDIYGVSGAWIKISPTEEMWCCISNSYGRYMRKV